MPSRRTTVAADTDDLAVLESEARRRGVALTQVLREAVEREADRLRRRSAPRFGIVRGDGTATTRIASDEHAPARRHDRS
jgi:metallophosphoesterase superfamily enzyme